MGLPEISRVTWQVWHVSEMIHKLIIESRLILHLPRINTHFSWCRSSCTQISKFMGPTWGPPRSCRSQMGPMLAPWTLVSGYPLFEYRCRLQWLIKASTDRNCIIYYDRQDTIHNIFRIRISYKLIPTCYSREPSTGRMSNQWSWAVVGPSHLAIICLTNGPTKLELASVWQILFGKTDYFLYPLCDDIILKKHIKMC